MVLNISSAAFHSYLSLVNLPGILAASVSAGGYISIFKSLILLALLFVWAKMLAWADKDALAAHLPRTPLNIGNLSGMIVAFGIFFFLPITFFLTFPLLVSALAVEAAVYLVIRNKIAGLTDLRQQFKDWRAGILNRKVKDDSPGAVGLQNKAGPIPVPTSESSDRAAYDAVQIALTDPLRKEAEQIDLAPAQNLVAIKYTVDCVGYTLPTQIEGATGAAAIAMLKAAAGLDANERRKPQVGMLKLTVDGQKREARVQSAGTTAGEFLRMIFGPSKRHAMKLAQLGFDEQQLAQVKDSIREGGGVVLLATPKGHGLTNLMYGMMRGHDAFLQHLQTIERDPADDIEGVTPNKLAANATPADELQKVDWVISQEPDAFLIDKVENPQSAASIIQSGAQGKRVYMGMRAGSCIEAIEQWKKLVGNDQQAIEQLRMVICGRVLRKLCVACKESYAPDPATLKRLNMDPEKVTTLYKAREVPLRDPKGNPIPCEFCRDIRFKGRTGVFEVLIFSDDVREALRRDLAAGGRVGSQFKAAFRKQKGRYLQEVSLGLVQSGETSVQEVLRVLKTSDEAPRRAGPKPEPGGAAAAASGGPPRSPPARGVPRPTPRPSAPRPPA